MPPPAEPASPQSEDKGELLALLAALAATVEDLSERLVGVERRPWMVWPTPSTELDQWVNGWFVPTFRFETVLEGLSRSRSRRGDARPAHLMLNR
ncbi:hypothetical protein SAMN02745244_00549 [Tessaracoccus bendigoensis DSM 12906]|uniref:Uncharacterized protein n=1 Tax=Tessaracoccus bendigoensis DSM 12906 TaxID=1123357 RepID=A0A1M6BXS9_9ACTN|nr:hypothetical protein SAMN02745244_00549 [Tessaracoccus bendigoensis DSM 12906]